MTDHAPGETTSIRLTRSGGLAGVNLVASVKVDELPAEAVAQVRSALARLKPPTKTAGSAGQPAGADLFQYDLVVETGGRRRSFTAHDGNLTPEEQALVDVLLPLARPE